MAIELGINSYVAEQELLDYFAVRLGADSYTDSAKNQQAILLATTLIDQLEFIGQPTDQTQLLQWPRVGVTNRNGLLIASNTIPGAIKDATCELAFFLLRNDTTDPVQYRQLYKLTSSRVGEPQNSYKPMPAGKLPDFVTDLLKQYLAEKSQYSSQLIP